MDRPGLGKIDRPTTLPADRPSLGKPGIIDRPGMGKDLPGIGSRPGIGDRPIIGGRPGLGDRPGVGDRPIIGGGNNIGNKIGIGNNIGSGNVGNWIGNDFNFNFNNFNRPGWGYGGNWHNHWGDHWYNNHVHYHHHGWYHGCWSGHWGNNWYVPVAVGATYWGLTALTRTWGYGYYYGYVNPYYVAPTVVATAPAYDYSQPIVINNYIESGDQTVAADAQAAAPAAQAPAESTEEQAGYALVDQGRDAFKRRDYKSALNLAEQAVQKVPSDPVIHEFGALCLFALGDYQRAAGVLNALLAVAPGMDWTTLISLYSSSDEYTAQLLALETHVKSNPRRHGRRVRARLSLPGLRPRGFGAEIAAAGRRGPAERPGGQADVRGVERPRAGPGSAARRGRAADREAGRRTETGSGQGGRSGADHGSGRPVARRTGRQRVRPDDRRARGVHLEGHAQRPRRDDDLGPV